MPKTVADAVANTRAILQDNDTPYRYSDADLVTYLNDALLETRKLRPDLFRAYWGTGTPFPEFTDADIAAETNIPINNMYFTPLTYFMAGTAELRDDEFTVDARAATLLNQFVQKLTMAV
jgi:hypothetical protein